MLHRILGLLLILWVNTTNAADTVLKLYRPYGDVQEQMTPVVTSKLTGQCLTQSKLIVREDAWRCQVEHVIYDPCFVKTSGAKLEVICPQSPWKAESVLIKVQSPLISDMHTPLDMSRALPWGMELANGEFCQAIDTEETFDSMPIRYKCNDKAVLLGHLQRCSPEWTMLEKSDKGVQTVVIRKAWF
jgi:hypothetical protein